uniref:NADH-ubiquinone oxidoreductase chain 4 n=1 Tax=Encyrtus infelix TaxID=355422 RepID=A0A411FRF9_9HYME|nr:NADH dehydrogenase subunit 4 [Encyrtus infelix]QBA96088.1 NADH dehydrogenase subunit 4 [Encyrtus infelix]QBA96101.1 NADH dehydrogenase subunit 4 [Encyrtus infelix]
MMKLMFMLVMLIYMCGFKKNKFYYLSMNLLMILFYLILSLNFNNYYMMIYSGLGLDLISSSLVLLTLWIFMLVVLTSWFLDNSNYYYILILLSVVLIFSFSVLNFFMFYIFFEISLIPVYLIIMGWGYQPERVKASFYMFIYTLIFSLPFLFMLFILFCLNKSLNFIFLDKFLFNSLSLIWGVVYFFMFMGFFVKLPLFMVHSWLPKAHVEAPVSGSMILAAVMLKLGGYGVIRLLPLMNWMFILINDLVICLCFVGILMLSATCVRLYDMKIIVAYSSVVHMGMMLVGMLLMNKVSAAGGFLMMISHGLCSSGMFLMVNFFYDRYHSRNIYIIKGGGMLNSSLMLLWFLLCVDNMGAPISLNLLSEVYIVLTILKWSKLILIMLIFCMFFSALYNLYLFSFSSHGKECSLVGKINNNNILEYFLLLMHLIPLNLLILKVNLLY